MLNIPVEPTIFVQIASYRDSDLVRTINSCIAKAKRPNKLRFGICWQHDGTESLGPLLFDRRVRVVSVDWSASQGCCWARSKTQMLYEGEDLTLQIDSHMRFAQDWDEDSINMLKECDYDKPILTYYPPPFEKVDGKEVMPYMDPQALILDKFESGFIPYYGSMPLPVGIKKPTLGRFIAAGFLFTIGRWCKDVPYNPNIYFLGEETDLALRSFTYGYNIYHPYRSVCWHHFIRKGEPHHWEDHGKRNKDANIIPETYVTKTFRGYEDLKKLFWQDNADLGPYSLGKVRSRRDYELFAGLNFQRRLLHPDAKLKHPPITTDQNWEEKASKRYPLKKTITLDLSEVPVLDDYDFWYFGLHDTRDFEVYRKDIRDAAHLVNRQATVEIDTVLDHEPKTWTLWPVSKSKGWQKKITRPLQ